MVLSNDNILAPYQANPDVPQGTLTVMDTSMSNTEATRDEFGTRVVARYLEVADGG